MDNLIIIGASGHARVCLEIFEAQGRKVLGFYDDDASLVGTILHGYQILGNVTDLIPKLMNCNNEFIIAIGNNADRRNIMKILNTNCPKKPVNAIHPTAIISKRTDIGLGNFIAAGVIINTGTMIGNNVIVNTGATIDHDNKIEDFAQISPGCNLAGNVTVAEGVFIGTGAIVIPGKKIGSYAIVGAGAVVIDDIPPYSTAVGVPAKVIKQNPIVY